MEEPNLGAMSSVRRYSLAELDVIDFSTSDDFAVVVENMKSLIILKLEIEEIWDKEHEQLLWQFVIDSESVTFICYFVDGRLYLSFNVPNTPNNGFFYFIKTTSEKLTSDDFNLKIMYGIAKAPYFDSFYNLLYEVYFSMFLENVDWSKCIKTDYLQHQFKFLSQIFDLKKDLIGELIFYVPKDAFDPTGNVMTLDTELLNEIERTVMNWIWKLISLLMKQSHNDYDERCGPLEEIQFWEDRCITLNKAINQLNREDIKKCIEILKNGKSGCLPKIISVHQLLMSEITVATENVKFLAVLKKPCELIQDSKLTYIPKHLNLLLNSVKCIWKHSSYFNNMGEISRLLSKVNNFIIETCAKHIPLDGIFSETNFDQDQLLLDAIHCCNYWIQIFNASEKAHEKFAEKSWSVESIAPLMNLFIHRCEELIKVSEFKNQFKCDFFKNKYSKGHKCFEVVEQFEAIESYFWILLKDLAKYKTSCLNIHTTVWYDHFEKFKLEMHNLELSASKLMFNALNSIKEIEDGNKVLMMFEKYFGKEVINKDLKKCIKHLYAIFFKQVAFVKKKIIENRRCINSFFPNYGGVAFHLSLLSEKLMLQYKLLKSSCLWPEDYSININVQYQQVLEAISESIHIISLQWIKTIPKDSFVWLKTSMIIKVNSSHFIQMNIESNIVNLIEELYYWDKTGIEIPRQIIKLHEKSDLYLKRLLRMMQSVKLYNRIVSVLCANAFGMFCDTLQSLEMSVLPGLLALNWSSPLPAVNSSLKCLSEQTKTVCDVLSYHEESNMKIYSVCQKIKNKSLFSSNIKSPMEISEFIKMQVIYRENSIKDIHILCSEIISITKKLQSTYQKKKPEDGNFCSKYAEKIKRYICESLVECFLTSLKAVSSLFGIDRKNKMRVLIKIILTLKDNQLYFCPTFTELCLEISNLIEHMKNNLSCLAIFEEPFFESAAIGKMWKFGHPKDPISDPLIMFCYENEKQFKTFRKQNGRKREFLEKVKNSDPIKEVSSKIDFGLCVLHAAQKEYVEEWKTFNRLWETDKSTILTEYKFKKWEVSCFEDDINEFEDMAEKILYVQRFKTLDFCICDCSSLKNMAVAYSQEFKKELGSVFNDILSLNLQNAYDLINLTSKKFLTFPQTLNELKCCQNFLIKSKACSLELQSTFKLIHEIFCTLKKFGIEISKKILSQEKNLDRIWKNLEKDFDFNYTEFQKMQAIHLRNFLTFHKNLEQDIITLQADLHLNGPFQLKYDFTEALQKILFYKNKLVDYKEKEFRMKCDSKFFHVALKPLDSLKSLENELDNLRVAWIYAQEIEKYILKWQAVSLLTFDVPGKKRISDAYKKLIIELQENVKGSHWILLKELEAKLDDLEEYYNIILNFREPTLQERHWNNLKYILELPSDESINFFQSSKFNFEFLQNLKTDNLIQKTSVIAMQARKEYELEQGLKQIRAIWETVMFDMSQHNAFYKLDDTDNIVFIVEDHQTTLAKMKISRFVSHFSNQIDSLENSLCLILDVIDQANVFQTKFFLLEKLFYEQTIQAQLPKESVEFQDLITLWQTVSIAMNDEKLVWKISHKFGFLSLLMEMNKKIQAVQKSLETYLESKRHAFSRFYFISDDDLLSIIGQNSPKDIQPHLQKCFAGIKRLEMINVVEEKGRQQQVFIKATGMHSFCKEYVEFPDSVPLGGPVESWMLDIEGMMQKSLNGLLHNCLEELANFITKDDFNFTEMKWLHNWPGQICFLSMQIIWTAETSAAIKLVQESAVIFPLKTLKKIWKQILSQFIKKLGNESQALIQMKCMTTITILVKLCDTIDYLIKCICNDVNAFEWLVQLRFFYDDETEECLIQQMKSILKYGFEYLGNGERLIITPLTERCFISITSAFFLHQGILMKGSKASGKTETLKELGKLIGNYVLIINCSENHTHFSLVRMLSGLAQIGAWGIFEEFDNVHFEIISVLTQQFSAIFHSLSLGSNFFSFLGKENLLDEKCGIFLTINADKKMNTLPLILMNIFRPVTITSPDILTIIEVYLIMCDFEQSEVLSKDIYSVFKMMREQLSNQPHYDFGLPAIINFLKHILNIKRTSVASTAVEIIISSFNYTIIPKLIFEDIPVFQMVLETVLGSLDTVFQDISHIKKNVEDVLKQNFLCVSENQVGKIIQFHEMINNYQNVILLGKSGTGKTVTWKTLKDVYSILDKTCEKQEERILAVQNYQLNPKAFSCQELFGCFDETGEWIDGLFSTVLREACIDTKARRQWIILDGPVDIEWMKNISSLLDSTKVLTLANGERILLPDKVLIIIETTDLSCCTPAEISHCGVVYHHSDSVGWKTYFYSWLKKIDNKKMSIIIEEVADKYLDAIVEFPFKSVEEFDTLITSRMHCIVSFCKIMNTFLKQVCSEENLSDKIARLFWFSAIWTIGSVVDERGKLVFNEFIHNLSDSFLTQDSIFDFGLDENLQWIKWNDLLPSKWSLNKGTSPELIMVPTKMTIAYEYIIKNLLSELYPVFLYGKMCSGKSTIVKCMLNSLSPELYKYTMMNISCQSSSKKLQHIVEVQLTKKAGNIFIPDFGQKLIVFLDDMNLAVPDQYESVSFLELLTMHLNCHYWFNRQNWKINHILNTTYICAMSPISSMKRSGTYPNQCLLSHFNVFNILSATDSEIKHIFTSLLREEFVDSSLEVQRMVNAISLGSFGVLKSAVALFRPTPSKLHYLFSMHDVKKVIFRLLKVSSESLNDKAILTKFWFHECLREFSDKLISQEDRIILFKNLCEVVGNQFLIPQNSLYEKPKPLFVKFLNPSEGYKEVKDLTKLTKNIENCIKNYKDVHSLLPVVLFDYAVEHLCQIIRGIEVPYGNMVLIGLSGTGRLTLSRLAAYILKYEVFEVEVKGNYEIIDFKHDLQKLLQTCGVRKKDVVFLITDSHIKKDEFLLYVAEILSGDVSYLFSSQELEKTLTLIMQEYESENIKRDECLKVLTENIKKYLHIVFCVNYATPFYKKCIIHYPAIYKYSTCLWFEDWPRVALEAISRKVIENFSFIHSVEEKIQACTILPEIHEIVLKYVKDRRKSNIKIFHTSSAFITFVNTFKNVYAQKSRKVYEAMERLDSGLIKIKETQEKVNEIAKETKQAQENLIIAEGKCDVALIDIKANEAIISEKQEAIQSKKIEIENSQKICKKIAIAAQEDLNAALPALEEAKKALEALNKRDIGEIKSYAKPPVLVEMVLEAVMILRNSEPSWAEAKRQLGSPSFLKELIEHDKDNISDTALRKIEKYVKRPEFNSDIVGKVSAAAKSLSIWVRAMYMYGEIYKKVKPKQERLRIAQEELKRLQNILATLLKELDEYQTTINQLQREHSMLLKRKEEYAKDAKLLSLKLDRANSVMHGLSSERKRWTSKVLAFSEKKKFVFGDSFIAAGYITYLGPYDQYIRLKTCEMWGKKIAVQHLLCSSEFDLADFFIDESVISEWTACGLPTDQYSHENAAIVTESYCCPFIIDPEGQALKWIKNMELKQGLKICDMQSTKWLSIIENAIVEGYPVLFHCINAQLDSTLEPLFNKTYKEHVILFNNKELNVHKNFHLYILSKSSNLEFPSVLIKKMCIVNFAIKEKGLEDQLLPLIVHYEHPTLEIVKEQCVKNIRKCKAELLVTENTILKLLSESRGSLLDDEELVEALNKSKSISIKVEEDLATNEKKETEIDSTRQKYHPGARNAAILYFVLSDMALVDPMYIFTLDAYMSLFVDSISKSEKVNDVNRRVQKLKSYHQFAVYKYACRTVSVKHSLLLAFHICCRILNSEGKLEKEEYEFFIYGGRAFDPTSDPPNPCQRWLPQKCWEYITQLESLPKFLGITVSLDETSRNWQNWYLASEPEKISLPGNWRNVCSDFERLLIIRCLRIDRISSCVRNFILNNFDIRFLEYPEMNLYDIIRDSSTYKPIVLFKFSNDVDIDLTLANLANDFGMSEKYRTIMLGEGQGPIAGQLIVDAVKSGFWVFISNCHLQLSWMPVLEKIVSQLTSSKVNPNFRLFLGSSPTEFFPASILQCSVVLTFDAPKGIRENLLKLYQTDILKNTVINKQELKYRSLVFALAFFHSLLIERKRFQNLGWNVDYSFTEADFKVSVKMLQTYLSIYKEIPWDAFKMSIAEICYKNHVTDERDKRLLMTYYKQCFCDEVCSNTKFQLTSLEYYYIPEDGPFENYVEYIKTLPLLEEAEVFGQHPNSEILYRIQEGESILKNLDKFLGDTLKYKEENLENEVIKIIEDLNEEIPSKINEEEAENVLIEKPEPYSYVLIQETKRHNILVNYVKKSLEILKDCATGKQKMTEKAEHMMKYIQKMEVPPEWHFAYPSLKPLGSWIQDLKLRIQQFQIWCSTVDPPEKFWLPGFTSPKSILNAALLTTVKNSDMVFKDLEWEYHVSTLDEAHIKEAPLEGIYIRGLFLEGAGWDRTNSLLTDPEPLHLSVAMPVIHFKPVIESSMRGLYTCPCYYTSNRTNDKGSSYLFDIKLKTKKSEEYWIKRGTAIILSNND